MFIKMTDMFNASASYTAIMFKSGFREVRKAIDETQNKYDNLHWSCKSAFSYNNLSTS
jgi:hypothetical protein